MSYFAVEDPEFHRDKNLGRPSLSGDGSPHILGLQVRVCMEQGFML